MLEGDVGWRCWRDTLGYLEAWCIINQQSNQSNQSERKLIYQVGPPCLYPMMREVPRCQGSKVSGYKGAQVRYGHLKVIFVYELDSKECPSSP